MAKTKYTPEWFYSPFGHIKYTLVRTKKQSKKLGFNLDIVDGAKGQVSFFDDDTNVAIVHVPYSDVDVLYQNGLIVHESVHIWQEIKTLMSEKEPSIEFEAYSIQKISQDLMYLLELSNG